MVHRESLPGTTDSAQRQIGAQVGKKPTELLVAPLPEAQWLVGIPFREYPCHQYALHAGYSRQERSWILSGCKAEAREP